MPDAVQPQTHHVDLRRVVQDFRKGAKQRPTRCEDGLRQFIRAYRLGEMRRNVGACPPDDHGVSIYAANSITHSRGSPEVNDQRAQQFLGGPSLSHRVMTACVDQLEGVTNPHERRLRERPRVKPGAPKNRAVEDELVGCRQLLEAVEREGCRRIERALRVERVMLVACMKDTDGTGGGFLEPVTGATTHPQADPHSDLVAREGPP